AAVHVVAEAELCGAAFRLLHAGIPSKAGSFPDREDEAVLQLKEGHSAVFVFRAEDASRGQAKTVPIERERAFQVIYPERNRCQSRLHELIHLCVALVVRNVLPSLHHLLLSCAGPADTRPFSRCLGLSPTSRAWRIRPPGPERSFLASMDT